MTTIRLHDLPLAELGQHIAMQPVARNRVKGLGPDVSTATALGVGSPGATGTVVAADGTRMLLSWDSTNLKWISDELIDTFATTGADTSSGTTYASIARNGPYREWKVWTDAGLTMEVRAVGALIAGTSSSIFLAAAFTSANASGTATVDLTHTSAEISHNSTTSTLKDSGWVALNASATAKDYISIGPTLKRTGANNGSVANGGSIRHRWVYTP